MTLTKVERRIRIKRRIRKVVFGTASRPRLSVFRSNKQISAQLIDDNAGKTLVSASSLCKEISEKKVTKTEQAQLLGAMIAEKKAIETSIESDSESYRDLVRKKISETEESIRDLDDAEKAGEEELGRLLFSTGGDWIGEDTPHDILDIIEQMLGIMQRLDELRYKHGCLERNAKRDEYLAMIESEAGKIKVLEDDKARIEQEIEDIRLEIARLQREADKLAGDEYV